MASPFYLFRKYQKTFLVIAGVLAMFIFVVADPLMSWIQSSNGGGRGPRSANAEVASWNGGSMNVGQLENLSRRRFRISDFMQRLYAMAAGLVEQEGGTPVPPALPDFRLRNANTRSVQLGVIRTQTLADQAEKSGISLSDDVINYYLREWGLRRMGDPEIRAILQNVNLRDKQLFAGLREMLMAQFYLDSYVLASQGIMPEERWQDWKRINERIAVEAAVLPTDSFLDEVPEPSESQLQAFYEQHKQRVQGTMDYEMGAELPSAVPGFRTPRRVRLQYLQGNVQDWTVKMMDQVTDEEIADFYERNKRSMFVKAEKKSTTSAEGLFDDEEPEDEEAQNLDEDREEASTDDAPTESSGEPASAGEEPAEDESSRVRTKSPFRLTALQTEPAEQETPTEETPAGEPASAGGNPEVEAEDNEAEDNEAEDNEAEDNEAEDNKAEDNEAEDNKAEDNEAEDNEAEDNKAEDNKAETPATDEPPVEYEPLEEVSDQIRRSLATDKAVQELQNVVDHTYSRLQSAYNPYGAEVVLAQSEDREVPKPPAALSDFVSIAKETGLTSEETVLLPFVQLRETLIGQARDVQSLRETVARAMFLDQELFEPYRAVDLDGNSYIVSKVEDVESSVPKLEDIREQVVAAWKQQEAAKLALKKAEQLAKQSKESGDPLVATAQEQGFEVEKTDMFSWLDFGTTAADMQRGPRLGEAPPLEAVGPEFMATAFKLQPDDRVALLSHDHSSAYVLQLADRERTKAELRKQFLAEANNWFGLQAMTSARLGTTAQQLITEITDKAGLNLDKFQELIMRDEQ